MRFLIFFIPTFIAVVGIALALMKASKVADERLDEMYQAEMQGEAKPE